jgi:lipopolysaccharide/colanic/teichoic acid biosynthesis glycosyltransferase
MALARRIDPSEEQPELVDDIASIGPGFARRALDIALSSFALLLLAVPFLIIAIAVRLDSRGPSFYRQRRIGQGGVMFGMIKFRTMQTGSAGSLLTGPGDKRVTRLGRFLRASAVDELPQLVNVLMGQMTLIGPRPQTPGLAVRYPAELQEVFAYRPGLAGPGVIELNDDDVLPPAGMAGLEDWYLANIVPARVELDLAYLRGANLRRTIAWMWQTLMRLPRHLIGGGSKAKKPAAVGVPSAEAAPEQAAS